MAEKTIRQKIELTGEKQYSQAIKAAQRNLKTLQSQLKAESAELGKNASEQQKAEIKAKSLAKQIAEQEKVVQTLKEALEQARKEYGDNDEVVSKWEIRLNNARTTLGNMRGSLETVNDTLTRNGDGFKEMAAQAENGVVATRSFAEALGSVADAGEAISGKIEGIFTGLVSTVRDAIADVWADVTELAGRANEWADLAGFWNTSAANIQKWYHAVSASHNDFATLNSAVTRIVMADNKKIAENAKVSAEGYEDSWEYAMAVMDSLAGMEYGQQLEALNNIFGERRATGVLDLLNDWASIRGNLGRFDAENGGIGMTEEQMSDMAALAEQVDKISQTWSAFKDSFLAGAVGKLSLDLTGNVQGALDALIGFMDAETEEEREQALADFTENLTAFFTRLGEAITAAAEALGTAGEEMQGSENGIVRALGDLLVTLRDVMEWFADEGNIDLVIKGFESLAAFWLVGKGLSMAGKISEMVANIATIKAFSGAGAAGAAAAGAGATATGTSMIGTAVRGAVTKVTGLAGQAGNALPFIWDWFSNNTEVGRAAVRGEGSVGDALTQVGDEIKKNAASFGSDWAGLFRAIFGDRDAEVQEQEDWLRQEMQGQANPGTPEEFYQEPEENPYSRGEAEAAIQDWWDAWRAFEYGNGGEEAEAAEADAYGRMEEIFGDGFMDLWDELVAHLDEAERDDAEDIPSGWYRDILDSLDFGEKDGVTSEDISGLRGLPALIQAAAENGTAAGVSGITVNLDGYAVGRLVTPYVSNNLGRLMMTR